MRLIYAPRQRCSLVSCAQSYGGGRDIVGLGDSTLLKGQEFKRAPIFDDGLIEVRSGCSALVSVSPACPATLAAPFPCRWLGLDQGGTQR